MSKVTTHDIEVDGTTYILEWRHDDDGHGHIAITEANLADEPCDWAVNDATVPSWCCNTHMYDGTGDHPATGEHPEDCDFKGLDLGLETYDFEEVE